MLSIKYSLYTVKDEFFKATYKLRKLYFELWVYITKMRKPPKLCIESRKIQTITMYTKYLFKWSIKWFPNY